MVLNRGAPIPRVRSEGVVSHRQSSFSPIGEYTKIKINIYWRISTSFSSIGEYPAEIRNGEYLLAKFQRLGPKDGIFSF